LAELAQLDQMMETLLKDNRLLGELQQYLRVTLHLRGILMATNLIYPFEG
jgi:hypothetical protein